MASFFSNLQASFPEPVQKYLTRENLQTLMRVVVIIATYLLFRPRLEKLFRLMSGQSDPTQENVQARTEFLKQQREGDAATPVTGKGKSLGIVDKEGKVVRLVAPDGQTGSTPAGKGSAKKAKDGRKKA